MLYEVITEHAETFPGVLFEQRVHEDVGWCADQGADAPQQRAEGKRDQELGRGNRITSYNVCYTKLLRARWVLGFYLLVDNLLPFLGNGGAGTGVAHGAHIGGFLAGLGLSYNFV